MKLVEKYKEKLINNDIKMGGYIYLNDNIKEKLLTNVNITEFNKLYITITIGLFDGGLIPDVNKSHIDYLKSYLEDSSNISMEVEKRLLHPNGYYAYLARMHPDYACLITAYMNHVYTDIITKHNDDIIYIDTDYILHTCDLDLEYLDLEYSKSKFDYLVMISPKRYAAYSMDENLPKHIENKKMNGYIVSGYSVRHKDRAESYLQLIKEEFRTNKINSLINN